MMSPKEYLRLSKRKYPKLFKIVIVLLVLLSITSLYSLTKLKSVSCLNSNTPCDIEINTALNRYLGSSLLSLKKDNIFQDVNKIRPIKSLTFHFRLPGHLAVEIETQDDFLILNSTLVSNYPNLSFSNIAESSDSATIFQKPSREISTFANNQVFTSLKLWFSGSLTPTASQSSNIFLFTKEKPQPDTLKDIFNILTLLNKYIKTDKVYILGNNIFLSRNEQPDIITSVPYSEGQLMEALQSLSFLTTMKKDSKIIDLRFKNPTIR